jgi:hypothetical protein
MGVCDDAMTTEVAPPSRIRISFHDTPWNVSGRLELELNELASEGWELISLTVSDGPPNANRSQAVAMGTWRSVAPVVEHR